MQGAPALAAFRRSFLPRIAYRVIESKPRAILNAGKEQRNNAMLSRFVGVQTRCGSHGLLSREVELL